MEKFDFDDESVYTAADILSGLLDPLDPPDWKRVQEEKWKREAEEKKAIQEEMKKRLEPYDKQLKYIQDELVKQGGCENILRLAQAEAIIFDLREKAKGG